MADRDLLRIPARAALDPSLIEGAVTVAPDAGGPIIDLGRVVNPPAAPPAAAPAPGRFDVDLSPERLNRNVPAPARPVGLSAGPDSRPRVLLPGEESSSFQSSGDPRVDAVRAAHEGASAPPGMTPGQQYAILGSMYGGQPNGGLVKAGQQTTVSEGGMVRSPELKSAHARKEAADATVAQSLMERANQAAASADAAAANLSDKSKYMAEQAVAMQKKQAEQQREMAQLEAQRRKDDEAYIAQAKTLDPTRLMHRGAGYNVLGAISIGLGAIGQSLSGSGKNFALDIMRDAMDRDYQAQKDKVGAAKEQATLSGRVIQDVRQRYQDEEARRLAYEATMLRVFASKGEEIAMRATSADAKARGAEEVAKWNAEAAQKDVLSNQAEAQHRQVSSSTSYQAGSSGSEKYTDLLKQMTAEAEAASARQKAFGNNPSEQDSTYAKDATVQLAGGIKFLRLIDRLTKQNSSWDKLTSGERNSNLLALTGAMGEALYGKTMTTDQEKRTEKTVEGILTTWTEGQRNSVMNTAAENMVSGMNTVMSGVHPKLKAEIYRRMTASGMPRNYLEAVHTNNWRGAVGEDADARTAGEAGGTVRPR